MNPNPNRTVIPVVRTETYPSMSNNIEVFYVTTSLSFLLISVMRTDNYLGLF